MPLFKKKPVVIEAWQYGGVPNKTGALPKWLRAAIDNAFGDGEKVPGTTLCVGGIVSNFRAQTLDIGTLEGVMTARVGDWIIQGVKGELYPCKPDIFAMTYEPATDSVPARTSSAARASTPTPIPDKLDAKVTT